jgi:glycine oxidase
MSRDPLVVIGAGLIGLSIAWELSRRGCAVLVLERDAPGAGASSAAAGMLALATEARFGEEALLALYRYAQWCYPRFVKALEHESGMRVEWRREGTLLVAPRADDLAVLSRHMSLLLEHGVHVSWLDRDAMCDREPALGPAAQAALWCPQDFQINNVRMIEALTAALTRRDVQIVRASTAARIITGAAGQASAVELVTGERIGAAGVIVAAGAWSSTLGGVPELERTVSPLRGQAIAVANNRTGCAHVIRSPRCYIVPKDDGSLVIGATSEEVGFEGGVTGGGVFSLLQEARLLLPAIDDAALNDTWSSWRPATRDGAALIGASSVPGVWLATGHGRHGVLLTPATAQLIADAVEGVSPATRWPMLDPLRFNAPLYVPT